MPKSANEQKFRKNCINQCIKMIGKNKHKFDNLTSLAKYVALRVSEKELQHWNDEQSGVKPKSMAHQTLLTNKEYKKILLDFMGESEEDKHILDNLLVKATLLGKDLEIKSLKETVERLEKAIGEAYSTETKSDKVISHDGGNEKELMVIHKLIGEFSEFIKINENNGLSNVVNFPPTEVANSDEMSNYMKFLKDNKR
jgi:hypothetical protein